MSTEMIERAGRRGQFTGTHQSFASPTVPVRGRVPTSGIGPARGHVFPRGPEAIPFGDARRDGTSGPTGQQLALIEGASPEILEPQNTAGPLHDASVLIVDDCKLTRENLATSLTGVCTVPARVAWDLPSLITAMTARATSLILLNISTRHSAALLQAALEFNPVLGVIALGIAEDDEDGIVACAEAGVAGYHLRNESLADLLTLMSRVAEGESRCSPKVSAILLRRLSALAAQREPFAKDLVLTEREVQILRMLERGLANRDIADRLCIAVHTVKNHVHNILTKLGVSTRAEAAARFRSVQFTEVESAS